MKPHNFAGNILIILGVLISFFAASTFIMRAAIFFFGLYLIFQGLKLKNNHQRIVFFFDRFTHRR